MSVYMPNRIEEPASYEELIRQSEQLRILKGFIKAESTLIKKEIINLINVMEANNE